MKEATESLSSNGVNLNLTLFSSVVSGKKETGEMKPSSEWVSISTANKNILHLLYFHYKEKVSHREFVKHDVICLIHLWPSPVLWSSKTSITACLKLYNLPLTSAAAGRKLTNDRLVMADTMFRSTAVILLPRQHLWTNGLRREYRNLLKMRSCCH